MGDPRLFLCAVSVYQWIEYLGDPFHWVSLIVDVPPAFNLVVLSFCKHAFI